MTECQLLMYIDMIWPRGDAVYNTIHNKVCAGPFSEDFRPLSEDFKDFPKFARRPDNFLRFPEDYRRELKTAKDNRGRFEDVSITHQHI